MADAQAAGFSGLTGRRADLVRASMLGVFWRNRTGNFRVIGTIQNGARRVSSSRSATGAMVIDESKLKEAWRLVKET
jgi:hypothetical protein